MLEFDNANKKYTAYINGSEVAMSRTDIAEVSDLYNTTINIKEFVVYDRVLNSTEKQQLIQELGGNQ